MEGKLAPEIAMRIASKQRALEYRYELYRRAHEAYEASPCADVAPLEALAHGCKRTLEMITMAKLLVENRYPTLAIEHVGEHHAGCDDCSRAACVSDEEIDAAEEQQRLLSA